MARRRSGRVIDSKTWTGIAKSDHTISTNTTTGGNGFSTGLQSTILRVRGSIQMHFDATQ